MPALMEQTGQPPLNHRQLRVLELLIREPEEPLIRSTQEEARTNRSTREEAEADVDGMVRTMLLEESPRENVNPTCRLARGG